VTTALTGRAVPDRAECDLAPLVPTTLVATPATGPTSEGHTPVSTPIIDNNALTASLRALKLSGMLQTLDARLAQARAGEFGCLEFLDTVALSDRLTRPGPPARPEATQRAFGYPVCYVL
jgi:hypothetical protein